MITVRFMLFKLRRSSLSISWFARFLPHVLSPFSAKQKHGLLQSPENLQSELQKYNVILDKPLLTLLDFYDYNVHSRRPQKKIFWGLFVVWFFFFFQLSLKILIKQILKMGRWNFFSPKRTKPQVYQKTLPCIDLCVFLGQIIISHIPRISDCLIVNRLKS